MGALLAPAVLLGSALDPAAAGPAPGRVVVVQAVPGAEVTIAVDGKAVERKADVGSMTRSMALSPGTHDLVFTDVPGSGTISTRLKVASGSNSDVVLHQPASVDGAPVVNTYRTPLSPIGPDKARVLLAHTATAPPADVRVDKKVVFTNIANGEFADADVPAGAHQVALLPTGATTKPILGPLPVKLQPRTVTMVYAVGNPKNGSMDAVVHRVPVEADGSVAPATIDTGSAGLAAHAQVVPFEDKATSSTDSPETDQDGSGLPFAWWGLGGFLVAALGLRWWLAAQVPRSDPGNAGPDTSTR